MHTQIQTCKFWHATNYGAVMVLLSWSWQDLYADQKKQGPPKHGTAREMSNATLIAKHQMHELQQKVVWSRSSWCSWCCAVLVVLVLVLLRAVHSGEPLVLRVCVRVVRACVRACGHYGRHRYGIVVVVVVVAVVAGRGCSCPHGSHSHHSKLLRFKAFS